jgi:multidrug transporter EmrE-like cation transporter
MSLADYKMSFNATEGVILFTAHALLTVVGLLILKTSVGELDKFSIESLSSILTLKLLLGLSLYVAAFLLSLVILHKFPLSVSVSIMMPLSLITATVMGYVFLNEDISVQSIVGLVLILVGIFFIYMETN